jgi:hypothetical protein
MWKYRFFPHLGNWRGSLWFGVAIATLAFSFSFASATSIDAPDDPQAFPGMISYQGLVEVNGEAYHGSGYFKFAIVGVASGNGTNYWAHDGTASGEPGTYVTLPVTNGLFGVNLGDTSLMTTEIGASVFKNDPTYLRVWFSSSSSGPYQALEPNQRLVSVAYAMNSDLLDGQDSSYYRNADNIFSGTLNTARFSAYADLSSEGYVGDEFGDLAKNNGSLQPSLNADLLDGESGSYYRNASNLFCGTISNACFSAYSDLTVEGYLGNATGDLAQNNGTLQSSLNADQLDGQEGSYYRNATNINNGTLSTTYYSAYSDLQAESRIGSSSSQVAAGDHDHLGETWTSSSEDGLDIDVSASLAYALKAQSYGNYGIGVWAIVGSGTDAYAIQGETGSTTGRGVNGFANATSGNTIGVFGRSDSTSGTGVVAYNSSLGTGLEAYSYSGNIIEGWDGDYGSSPELRFKIENDGDVYADGSYYGAGGVYAGSADFAEMLPQGQDDLEPGDVLAIGKNGKMVRSTTANQTSVMGVYSTEPGFVGGASWIEEGQAEDEDKIPLAIVGVVPVKASAENGVITPGDLLVSASIPGHAMKAGESPAVGTVLGKALEALEDGTGLILMLVMLQ